MRLFWRLARSSSHSFEGRSNERDVPKTFSAMPRRAFVVLSVALLAFLVGAPTASAKAPKAPKGLKAFLLRVNEPESLYNRNFPRTPAFAWNAVGGAKRYEFEVSTSENFSDSAVIY